MLQMQLLPAAVSLSRWFLTGPGAAAAVAATHVALVLPFVALQRLLMSTLGC
jgi:hypothetical protein